MCQVGPIGMPVGLTMSTALPPTLIVPVMFCACGADVGDVVRVDRRQQAQHHDQQEQAAEEQRDLVAAQPPPGQLPRTDAGREILFAFAAEVGRELVGELGAGTEIVSAEVAM